MNINRVFVYCSKFVPESGRFVFDLIGQVASAMIFEPEHVGSDQWRHQQQNDYHQHYDCRYSNLHFDALHSSFKALYACRCNIKNVNWQCSLLRKIIINYVNLSAIFTTTILFLRATNVMLRAS